MNEYKLLLMDRIHREDAARERRRAELRRDALLARAASPDHIRGDWWKTLLAHLRLPIGSLARPAAYQPPRRLMLDTGDCPPPKPTR